MFYNFTSDEKRLLKKIRESVSSTENSSELSFHYNPTFIVLNISEGCNLSCPYCFAGQGLYGSKRPSWMTEEVAYNTVYVALTKYHNIRGIKLFGGEPFMNIRAMRGACRAVKDVSRNTPNRSIMITSVTNMTILNSSLINLIKEYDIHFTVSIDGPKLIHDQYRKFANGKGSFDRIKYNLDKLSEHKILPSGFESVYTPFELELGLHYEDIVDYIIQEFNAPWVYVSPVYSWFSSTEKEKELQFANQLYSDVKNAYYKYTLSKSLPKKRLANDVIRKLFTKSSNVYWCGIGQNSFTVSTDGTVYPCYVFLNDRNNWKCADSIDSLSQDSIPKSIKDKLSTGQAKLHSECSDCVLSNICRGCPAHSYISTGNYSAYDQVTCAYRLGQVAGVLSKYLDIFPPKQSLI